MSGALIDLDRWPVTDPDGAGAPVIARERTALLRDGVSIMEGFLRPEAVRAMVAEAEVLAEGTYHQDVRGTPYLAAPDPAFPGDHPRRWTGRSALTAVAYDQFPADSLLRALYEWDPLMRFVERIVGHGTLHRFACPLGALNVAAMAEGDELSWHFDSNDFVVSIALRSSVGGGEFLAAHDLRSDADESYPEVAEVLAGGGRARVKVLPMIAGTLMVFAGRRTLHAVSPVTGPQSRLVALLAYDTRPDVLSSDLLRRMRYGRPS